MRNCYLKQRCMKNYSCRKKWRGPSKTKKWVTRPPKVSSLMDSLITSFGYDLVGYFYLYILLTGEALGNVT